MLIFVDDRSSSLAVSYSILRVSITVFVPFQWTKLVVHEPSCSIQQVVEQTANKTLLFTR
ncbi:hypothetical protein BH09BAC4_BH09BAC4_02090 [soil metagenome]